MKKSLSLAPRAAAIALVGLLAGCSAAPTRDSAPVAATAAPHDNLNATLWMQTAIEYEATARGAFALASLRLDAAIDDSRWNALPLGEARDGFESLPPAVIVDADETMIDNSPFQARGVNDGKGYSGERWQQWVDEGRATAVPGALEFARHAQQRGVTVMFVSNRKTPAEFDITVKNLRALGFPIDADAGNVRLRRPDDSRDKSARRRLVAQTHRVLLLVGDNLGDFLDVDGFSRQQRIDAVAPYADRWGKSWIMLPNPTYGSWEDALLHDCATVESDPRACKRASLRLK